MLKVNIYRRTYVNDMKRERAHEREEPRKMIILLNILGSNLLITMFGPSLQYLTTSLIENLVISSSTKKYGKSIGQNSGESRW